MDYVLVKSVAASMREAIGTAWHYITLPWDRSPLRFVGPALLGAAVVLQRSHRRGAVGGKPELLRRGSPAFRTYYQKAVEVLNADNPMVRERNQKALALEWIIEDDCKDGRRPDLDRILFYLNEMKEVGNDVLAVLLKDRIYIGDPLFPKMEIYKADELFTVKVRDNRGECWEVKYDTPEKMVWGLIPASLPTHHVDDMIHMYKKVGQASNFIIAADTHAQFETVDGVIKRRADCYLREKKLKI